MKKAFYIHKPIWIIFVKLVNYNALLSLLEYDSCNKFLKQIAADLSQIYKKEHLPMDLYYLENGLFALVTEKNNTDKIKSVARSISDYLLMAKRYEQLDLEINPDICIISCPKDIDNYESLFSFGNSFHTYLPSGGTVNNMMEEKEHQMFMLRNELDSILSNAISNKRFMMYYQPIYSVKHKKFLSAEALIRLRDEKYGFISPELFIPAAEKNGTIIQIGDFVLDEVCCFLAKCQKTECL